MKKHILWAAAVGTTMMFSAGLRADDNSKDLDKLFIKSTAIGNMAEMQLSQAAQSQAQNDQVKQFAQKMIQDHGQADQQIKDLAQKKGVDVPSDLPQEKKEMVDAIKAQQGQDFDQAYISAMKCDHAKDVAKFEDESQQAKDQDVKQFAAQMLPTLRQHQQQVLALSTTSGSGQAGAGSAYDAARTAGSSSGAGAGLSGSTSGTGTSGSISGGAGGTSGSISGGTSGTSGASGTAGGTSGSSGASSGGTSGSSRTGDTSGTSGTSGGASSGGTSGSSGTSGSTSGNNR